MIEQRVRPWYVLRTRSRHEKVVVDCLRERSINAYLPKRSVVRRRDDRRSVVELPVFPGYVFVQPDEEQHAHIRYIRGSCGLVMTGATPAVMPQSELEAVKALVDSSAELQSSASLMPGQRVKVTGGPFAGIHGELVRAKGQEHLVINVQLLCSSISVVVDSDMVSAL
ncbi:UpxY family transcription antiterminator [Lysobacter enzymogenes]|uniref:UpxY family transcription antiterminator n=1 Tax=Lysobacter enzymogenes TaxID=69 RepID=UPI001A974A36|nr:UpxY family transcription antiterminator [Lysobacter enzymogenes]QQP96977.1 transcription termination/antitermination NusG family protein [Lysobacter enzymogenes]